MKTVVTPTKEGPILSHKIIKKSIQGVLIKGKCNATIFKKKGHCASECWSAKGGKGKPNNEANLAQDGGLDFYPVLLMVKTNSKPESESS